MAIFIGRRPEEQFTRVPNAWARDSKLSTKAKGLLLYLLSHQDGYRLTVQQVIAENADGRDSIYKTLGELVEHGYLRRDQRRGERGKVGEVDYYVVDAPGQTAYGFTASGESGSGDDQGKRDETPGQTASGFSVSGSAVSGKPATKKTRDKKTKVLEDQKNTTSPNPSAEIALTDVVDAEIVEEGEESTSSLNKKIEGLIGEVQRIRPTWKHDDILVQMPGAFFMLGDSFEAVTELVLNTAKDPTSAHPSRIGASGNPHLRVINTALLIEKMDADDSTNPPTPPACDFEADESGISCKQCRMPKANRKHLPGPPPGNGGVGYVSQRAGVHNEKPYRGSTYIRMTDSHHPSRDYAEDY